MDCIFCKIINKDIPAKIVYEDSNIIAFHDITPIVPVHVLIVPKIHIENVAELTEENGDIVKYIHLAANEVARKLGIFESGYRMITNCKEDARQTVMHLHYHLLGGKDLGIKIV